jgi:hypothetical protein
MNMVKGNRIKITLGLSGKAQTVAPANISKDELRYHVSTLDYDCILCGGKRIRAKQYHLHETVKWTHEGKSYQK